MNKDVQCPYCGEWLEICHDDGQGYDEDRLHEQECCHCEKSFVFTTSIHFYYDASKADCLNDGNHKYELSKTYPKEFAQLECVTCGSRLPINDPLCVEAREAEKNKEGK